MEPPAIVADPLGIDREHGRVVIFFQQRVHVGVVAAVAVVEGEQHRFVGQGQAGFEVGDQGFEADGGEAAIANPGKIRVQFRRGNIKKDLLLRHNVVIHDHGHPCHFGPGMYRHALVINPKRGEPCR